MNKLVRSIAGLAVFVLSTHAAAGELTLAFVNTPRVLEEAPQAQKARTKLEAEFAGRDAEIGAAQRKLKALDERLARDSAVMSEQQRRKLERERLVQERELKRSREAFTEDLNLRRNEEFAKLQRVVAKAIVAVAEDGGYDLVFESGVVFASDRVNITDEVIQRLRRLVDAAQSKAK